MKLNNRYTEVVIDKYTGHKTYQLPVFMRNGHKCVLEYMRGCPRSAVRAVK